MYLRPRNVPVLGVPILTPKYLASPKRPHLHYPGLTPLKMIHSHLIHMYKREIFLKLENPILILLCSFDSSKWAIKSRYFSSSQEGILQNGAMLHSIWKIEQFERERLLHGQPFVLITNLDCDFYYQRSKQRMRFIHYM